VLLLLIAVVLLLPTHAHAARVALVIGNAAYPERPLKNPINDAEDLASALSAAGFKVTLKTNLTADAMKEAISEFGDALRRESDTGLFYFSGHGVQTPKGNYLLPTGRSFKRTKDVELFAVEARAVLSEMQQARNPLNILILDACRDSPLPAEERGEGSNKGLARMDAPSGSVIAFATAPGRTASDNSTGRNGLYTKHLVSAISTPGLRLEDVFKRVGAAVEKESQKQGGDQSPEEVMKLRSEQPFYFKAAQIEPRKIDYRYGPSVFWSDGTMRIEIPEVQVMTKTCEEGMQYVNARCTGEVKLYSLTEAHEAAAIANRTAFAGYTNWFVPTHHVLPSTGAGHKEVAEYQKNAELMSRFFPNGDRSFLTWALPWGRNAEENERWRTRGVLDLGGGLTFKIDQRYPLRLVRLVQ
jgi:hypothetical protein